MTAEVRAKAVIIVDAMNARGVFERLDAITRERRFIYPAQTGTLLDWELPEIGGVRGLARLSAISMRLAAERKEGRQFVRSFRHALALARAIGHQSHLIERLVAIAIVELALNELRFDMVESRLDGETLKDCAAIMDEFLPLPPPQLHFEGERLVAMDTVRLVYEDPVRRPLEQIVRLTGGDREREPSDKDRTDMMMLAAHGIADKGEAECYLESLYSRLIEATRKPAMAMIAEGERIDEDVKADPRQFLAGVIAPSAKKAMLCLAQIENSIRGTRVMLAIERYRAAHHAAPDMLDRLVPDFLADIPAEPYSEAPFRYRILQKGEDAHERPYLLYGIGFDLQDNNGTPHRKTMAAATNQSGPGCDFVLNAPRKPPPD